MKKRKNNTQSRVTSQVKIESNSSDSEVEGAKHEKEEYDKRLFKEKTIDNMKSEMIKEPKRDLYNWILSVDLVSEKRQI